MTAVGLGAKGNTKKDEREACVVCWQSALIRHTQVNSNAELSRCMPGRLEHIDTATQQI